MPFDHGLIFKTEDKDECTVEVRYMATHPNKLLIGTFDITGEVGPWTVLTRDDVVKMVKILNEWLEVNKEI